MVFIYNILYNYIYLTEIKLIYLDVSKFAKCSFQFFKFRNVCILLEGIDVGCYVLFCLFGY